MELISGKKLNTFSHSMAVLGVATGGVGSKIAKSFKMLKRLARGNKAAEAIQNGEKVAEV